MNEPHEQPSSPTTEQIGKLMSLVKQGAFADLVQEANAALISYPNSYKLWEILGSAYFNLSNLIEAERCARRAAELCPKLPSANINLAHTLRLQGKTDEALDFYGRTLELDPKLVVALHFRSLLFLEKRAFDRALEASEELIRWQPDLAEAHYIRGVALLYKAEPDLSIAAFDRAIELSTDYAAAYADKGRALFILERLDTAIECFRRALQIDPKNADTLHNLGNALNCKGEMAAANAALDRALSINPNMPDIIVSKLGLQAHICDFDPTPGWMLPESATPFISLVLEDDPEMQFKRSANAWRRFSGKVNVPVRTPPPAARPEKLRIGYFSADFHDHATAYLLIGLLREHDRSRFDISLYSYGTQKEGQFRESLKKCDLHLYDVEPLSDAKLVEFVQSHKLDIALDLKGYTRFTRSQVFAHRLAPIQINYLAYPGTLGTSEFDYLIADRVLIPDAFRPFYAENIINMPHTYQSNAYQASSVALPTRSEVGLPENGFVFCCFNTSFKISVREFDIWMRVLEKVEGSVLWLMRSNSIMEKNLRREASARGVGADRLIFAEKTHNALHLARHIHADLFLDTFNCNAHTTASDSLWVGVPIITKAGKQFCARVAASLLTAIGLDDLITETEEQYEALIIDLATNPARLAETKQRLARNRLTHPLFDTKRYTRNFESGLQLAYDRYFSGEPPADIRVLDQG